MEHIVTTKTSVTGVVTVEFDDYEQVSSLINAFEFVRERLPDRTLVNDVENFIYSLRELQSFMHKADRGIDIDSRRSD